MKTYKQFVTEALPALLAAPALTKAVGAGLAATGLTGMIMQARKQGEGKRSQPVDYGQGGTATPGPGRSTQRTHKKDRSAQRQADQARDDRRAEARRRAQERKEAEQRDVEQKIDDLIGSEADRRYAKQKRQERGIEEGMLPVPSMARRLMNNPPIPQQQDKEDKFKKQYDKKFQKYDEKIKDLKKELKASNKHRDEKLNYQYKDVTNPKRPSDPVKDLKKKGTA